MEPARRGAAASRRTRPPSPLPGAAPAPAPAPQRGRRSHPRRRLIFSLKGDSSRKILPKIEESLVAQARPSPPRRGKVPEAADVEKKEEKTEESTKPPQESSINLKIQGSSKDAEVTSSSDVTLPSGVSTLLLQCLDSTVDYNTGASVSPSCCLSPETFRNEGAGSDAHTEDFGKYKNSTFLDPSKAVTIDKIPQVLNLSAIPEPVLENFQARYLGRMRSSKSHISSLLSTSTTLAGKKVHKITPARERSPDLKPDTRSLIGSERKPDKGLKRKKKEKHLEEGPSSPSLVGAPGKSPAKAEGLAAEMLPSERSSAAEQISSTRPIEEENKALKSSGCARPAELDPLCSKWEICSIVKYSPRQKSSKIRIPVKSKAPCLPQGLPEDTITSTKNWVYGKRR